MSEPISSSVTTPSPIIPAAARRGRVLVVGNEKGGSGKSTAAIHLAIGLLQKNISVATIDLDYPQGTFTRYIENRLAYIEHTGKKLFVPEHHVISPSTYNSVNDIKQDERERYISVLNDLRRRFAVVIVDTPGSASYMSRLAHERANVVLTPLNDSFIDLDVVAQVDMVHFSSLSPSHYADMVMKARTLRANNNSSLDWIVMRNRLSPLASRNKLQIAQILEMLGQRFNFRSVAGFSERVAFRELFLHGLTLLDTTESKKPASYLAAKTEVDALLAAFNVIPSTAKLSA